MGVPFRLACLENAGSTLALMHGRGTATTAGDITGSEDCIGLYNTVFLKLSSRRCRFVPCSWSSFARWSVAQKLMVPLHAQGTATTAGDIDTDLSKAESLSTALLIMTSLPWALCLVIFSGVYWTYPRDKARVEAAAAAAAMGAGGSRSSRGSAAGLPAAPSAPLPVLDEERGSDGGNGHGDAHARACVVEEEEEAGDSDRQRLVVVPVREE